MTGGESQVFAARMDALPATAALVARFCAAQAVRSEVAARLALVVEELFTNIVQHGFGGDTGGSVKLALNRDGATILLVCTDTAPPFDPRPALGPIPPDLAQPLESRRVGGLGAWLVASLATVEGYERVDGHNRLTLRLALPT